jgi:Zn-dependent peptidase ImmA (M78 family)/plasmid maintenance system antidote protein VapI
MTEMPTFNPDWFSKPGDSLRALMIRRGVSPCDLAHHLNGGMATLRGLLNGSKDLDGSDAAVLARTLGVTESFWLKRQANYAEALERAVDRADAEEADAWLQLQVPGEKPRGRLTQEKRRVEVQKRLVFFNVSTFGAWQARYGKVASATLFRKSEAHRSDEAAIMMWLRSGEMDTDLVATRAWKAGNLEDRLPEIRKLSKIRKPERFLPKLQTLCAEAGVAVVAKKAPTGCPASGASRMVAPDKAMILLSFRGLSDDRFWFTVFHEIGHLLLHGARTFVDVDMEELDDSEREANEFASKCIVPANRTSEFEALSSTVDDITRFSVSVGVAPGLVVGQMQHHQMLERHQMNYLKRRWKWEDLAPLIG